MHSNYKRKTYELKNESGEVITLLTIAAVVVMGIATVITSALINNKNNKQSTTTKAREMNCDPAECECGCNRAGIECNICSSSPSSVSAESSSNDILPQVSDPKATEQSSTPINSTGAKANETDGTASSAPSPESSSIAPTQDEHGCYPGWYWDGGGCLKSEISSNSSSSISNSGLGNSCYDRNTGVPCSSSSAIDCNIYADNGDIEGYQTCLKHKDQLALPVIQISPTIAINSSALKQCEKTSCNQCDVGSECLTDSTGCVSCIKSTIPEAQTYDKFVGFNSHALANLSPGEIQRIVDELGQKGITTIRFFGLDGADQIKKVLELTKGSNVNFIVALDNMALDQHKCYMCTGSCDPDRAGCPTGPENWYKYGSGEYLKKVQQVADKIAQNPEYAKQLKTIELFNEPHCNNAACGDAMVDLMTKASKILHDANPNILISPGLMGYTKDITSDGNDDQYFKKINDIPYITANTCHAYLDSQRSIDDCNQAAAVTTQSGKFFYVGELGDFNPENRKDCNLFKDWNQQTYNDCVSRTCGIGDAACIDQKTNQRADNLVDLTKNMMANNTNGVMLWQYADKGNASDMWTVYNNDPIFYKLNADGYVEKISKEKVIVKIGSNKTTGNKTEILKGDITMQFDSTPITIPGVGQVVCNKDYICIAVKNISI